MKPKLLAVMLGIVVFASLLAGCERPAPIAQATATFSLPPSITLPSVNQFATQTAAAALPPVVAVTATAIKPAGQATAVPVQATAVPIKPAGPTATARPAVVVPSATPGRPATYTIQQGDTFYCIARRFNLDVVQFLSVNGLGQNSYSVSGQTVTIPSTGTWSTAKYGNRYLRVHPDTYTVQAGDVLNRIACLYGDVDPSSILIANNLKSAGDITAGMTLNIP